MNKDYIFKFGSVSIISIWLLLFSVLPLLCILVFSFLTHDSNHFYTWHFTWQNYLTLLTKPYLKVFWNSLRLSCVVTFLCLAIGYPFAYYITKLPQHMKSLFALLVVIPFWTSSLLRTYAIIFIIQANGLLNTLLLHLHLIKQPLQLLYTNFAVLLGMVYNLLPFVVLPLYANMEKIDTKLLEAAADLGAKPLTIFLRVILPQTRSGIFSAILLTFLPAMTLFYIPNLLGGAKSLLIGNAIQMQFISAHNWPLGSAIGISLTLLMSLLLWYYLRTIPQNDRESL